jgi:hypothetical protein
MRTEEVKDAICVTMEILSNWGNASWVGLTEVEFFDLSHTKLYVSPHDVDVWNTMSPGELGCLVNRSLSVSITHGALFLLQTPEHFLCPCQVHAEARGTGRGYAWWPTPVASSGRARGSGAQRLQISSLSSSQVPG